MEKIRDKRRIGLLTLLYAAVYFTSYISRINFGAVVLEIVRTEGYLKSAVSMAVTVSFVTYGAGQLVSGWLGDKASPRLLIFGGLMTTAVMNGLLPFCPGPGSMAAVWGVNGFAQSMIWPPLVKIMTGVFSDEDYRRASVRVSWGSSLGTIAVYLAAPVCILRSGWKSVFFIASAVSVLTAVVWMAAQGGMETRASQAPARRREEEPRRPAGGLPPGMPLTLCGIMAAIVCMGALRDGVTTWMPSFIEETYRLGSAVSILSGVILPVFSIACFQIALWLRNRKVHNELLLSGLIFFAGAVCAALLRLTVSYQAALSAGLSAALTGCMHGINLLLISMIPPHFVRYGNVSAVSGILNACTYLGSAASTCAAAFFSERFGWSAILSVWAAAALAGMAVCLGFARRWERMRVKE